MMRSVSAPAADVAPPESVALVLRSTPFKSSSTRRDLTTSYRGFKAAWTAIEQVQVLSQSCRRLGERAAEVLMAVREKLEEVEREETLTKGGKVVLERSYEFQSGKAGGELAGKTVFKIQSTMLDLQAFATDHLASSNHSRLALLVDNLDKTKSSLSKLSNSLLVCIATYSLSSDVTTSHWADEDTADLAKDHAALPRLFQLSIMLRGPIYERFTKDRTDDPASNETPGQRRTAFIEWCLVQNPMLRPGQPGVAAPPTAPTRPAQNGLGLGLPSSLTSGPGGVSMRRAATQPLSFQPAQPVSTPRRPIETVVSPSTESSVVSSSAGDEVPQGSPSTLTNHVEPPTDDVHHSPAFELPCTIDTPTVIPQAEKLESVEPLESVPTSLPKSDEPEEPISHSLDRSTSTVSSSAMTNSSSMGSILFEPVLPSIEVEEVRGDSLEARVDDEEVSNIGMEDEVSSDTVGEDRDGGLEAARAEIAAGEPSTDPQTGDEPSLRDQHLAIVPGENTEEATVGSPQIDTVEKESLPLSASKRLLGLALETPLPPSPQVEQAFTIKEEILSSPAQPPALLGLLEALPVDPSPSSCSVDRSPLLEPLKAPNSPALPPSPSLIVTSFDDEDEEVDESPPSPPPKPARPFRILSLDGGGLVGPIPQLLALRKYLSSLDDETSFPCRHFDLVVGTSSSALPALVLGQLGLSIGETLDISSSISRRAFGLEGPAASTSQGNQAKPRRVGRWSRFFNRGNRSSSASAPTVDRRTALDAALKQLIPSASAPLPLSRTNCRAAVLAFSRPRDSPSRAQEAWLSIESGMSLCEIVQASMALPSTAASSSFTSSPTSLNPSPSAIQYSEAFLSSPDQPVELVSLSIGYTLSSIPTADSKRLARTRLEALRQMKQHGAGNSATAEALSQKLSRNDRIHLRRIEPACDAKELLSKDEAELIDSWSGQIEGRQSRSNLPLTPQDSSPLLSPPNSPSSFKSQPPPPSPSMSISSSSPRKRSSPLNFFSSSARRSASSSEISIRGTGTNLTTSPPSSPFSNHPRGSKGGLNLSIGEEAEILGDDEEGEEMGETRGVRRGLRSSMSMGELNGGGGLYISRGVEGSMTDLRM
ncbi:hypothetical protein JCM16303_001060 [Sporobolomyces ruberrimus]